jgi:ABC-2 type transport system permease protein
MDRTLTSPIRRPALVVAALTHQALVTVVQSLIMFATGLAAGARYPGGYRGLLVVLACAVLVALIFGGLSDAVALLVHQQEALIAVSQFLVLPLAFLSSVMMAPAAMPSWVERAARYNPVDWAAVASREALRTTVDWGVVLPRVGLLAALALLMAVLATRAYRVHQRSL